MIEELHIRNFQVHRHLDIQFDPRVTTIIGPSDSGKSAVIRALRWVCLNRPNGDAFIREGSGGVKVRLIVDGHKIVRRRGGSLNLYSLDKKNFKAFGNEVPPEILKLVNINEINFQKQHDAAFWFSETPGQVSRELNAIVDLSVIDSSLYNINAELRFSQGIVRADLARLKGAREDLEKFKWVPEIHEDLCRLEKVKETLDERRSRWSSLDSLLTRISETTHTRAKYRDAATGLRSVVKLGRSCRKVHDRRDSLTYLFHGIQTHKKIMETGVPDLSPVTKALKKFHALTERRVQLTATIKRAQVSEEESCLKRQKAKDADAELKKRMDGMCPLCGKKR